MIGKRLQNRLGCGLLLVCLLAASLPVGGRAQSQDPLENVVVTYDFGRSIHIQADLVDGAALEDISIQIQLPGNSRSVTEPMALGPDGNLEYIHDISNVFVQAFSMVEFHFLGTLPDGMQWESPTHRFFYSDNRFDWQTSERAPFRLHWYQGSASFAQDALDSAMDGLNRANAILQSEDPGQVDIYVYSTLEDYQFTRGQLGQLWAGGHADPSAGLIIVSLPPRGEQQLEIERKLPHEVAHIALYQRTGEGYWNLPNWLNEGFASLMETFPNPDYEFLVSNGLATDGLIPLAGLCEAFPGSPAGAQLAYAQSTSFVSYLESVYGSAGLRALIDSYAAGAGCPTGSLVEPIGLDLEELEANWLSGQQPHPAGAASSEPASILPWLLIAAVTLVGPIILMAGARRKRK